MSLSRHLGVSSSSTRRFRRYRRQLRPKKRPLAPRTRARSAGLGGGSGTPCEGWCCGTLPQNAARHAREVDEHSVVRARSSGGQSMAIQHGLCNASLTSIISANFVAFFVETRQKLFQKPPTEASKHLRNITPGTPLLYPKREIITKILIEARRTMPLLLHQPLAACGFVATPSKKQGLHRSKKPHLLTQKPRGEPPKSSITRRGPVETQQRRRQSGTENGRETLRKVPMPRLLSKDPALTLEHVEAEEVQGHKRHCAVHDAIEAKGRANDSRHGWKNRAKEVERPAPRRQHREAG